MSRIIVKNAASGKEILWRHIRIKKSLDDICHTMELEIPPSERTKVHKHDKIEVRYQNPFIEKVSQREGGRRVTTVLVDEITAGADTQKHSIQVVGRSPARDIIDSTWSDECHDLNRSGAWTLRKTTQYIGEKFGIKCDTFPTNEPDPTGAIVSFSWQNESPWTKLIGEADNQGYIFTSNEAGNLYLWKVPALRGDFFQLTEGMNIKTISWTENGAEQFHEYIVTGGGNDARIADDSCPGNRMLTIDMTDPLIDQPKLMRRAETEMRRRRERRVTAAVSGWGLTDDQIKRLGDTEGKELFWVPNLLIPVKASSIGIDGNLLISEVEHEASPEIYSTTITVVNQDAYL